MKLKNLRSDYVRRTHVHCTVLISIPTSASLTLSLNSATHLLQDHGPKHFPDATSLDQLFSQDASGAIIVSVDCKALGWSNSDSTSINASSPTFMAFCIGCLWTMFLDHLRRTLTGSAQKDQKPYSTPEFGLTMAVRLVTCT